MLFQSPVGHARVGGSNIQMGNWGPELVEIANGELLLGKNGEYSAAIASEQLRDADPEYLAVAPYGFNLQRSLRE
jgi:iron complex transport system substrate-binding protein